MVIKKYQLYLVFACFFAISISMVFTTNLAVASSAEGAASDDSEDTIVSDVVAEVEEPNESGVSLQVGDIICQDGKLNWLIPGRYSHCQIYIGWGWVVESDTAGVHYSRVSDGDVYRVRTSSSVKSRAVSFARARIGLRYDYWLVSKQVYGSKYYCSELIWAGYLANGGPDIDRNPGWSWKYARGVAPAEVADDRDTYYVGAL